MVNGYGWTSTRDLGWAFLRMRKSYGMAFCLLSCSFSSPEPVVSWSRGRETSGSGSSRYRMSEHPVAHVQKLQISLLMLIKDFCPSPLHWGKNFISWAISREWLLWDALKMQHFTQLGFTDNLENLKKTVTETGWTNCWFAELRQLIGRLAIVWVMWFFFFQSVWRTNTGRLQIKPSGSGDENASCLTIQGGKT